MVIILDIFTTKIPDVKLLTPKVYEDERGAFFETFRDLWFKENVSNVTFLQDNHSISYKGTLRGLHFQTQQPQGKLVRAIKGEVFDVAVDLRKNSETFGKWVGYILSETNKRQLWVPAGFAHGFLTLSETAEFVYKCTHYYHPNSEQTLIWNDDTISIEWPSLNMDFNLSQKDKMGRRLNELTHFD